MSGEKIKQISESWVHASHRKSGGAGGIEDYLDSQTLQHLEKMNILPSKGDKTFEEEIHHIQQKEIFDDITALTSGRSKSGPDYLEISKQVNRFCLISKFMTIDVYFLLDYYYYYYSIDTLVTLMDCLQYINKFTLRLIENYIKILID